jgi:glycosyltransferase involved in cell wall biosynthesis
VTRFCVLLDGAVTHDGRVIRIVNTLAEHGEVDVFAVAGAADDASLFGPRVRIFNSTKRMTFGRKIIRHTAFHREYSFLAEVASATGRRYDVVYANDLPTLRPASILKRRSGARLVYDSHEIYLETLNQFFPERATLTRRVAYAASQAIMRTLGRQAERSPLAHVDAFVTVNHSLARYFEARYSFHGIRVVMNAPPYEDPPPPPSVDFRLQYGWNAADRIFVYQGTLNRGRGFQVLMPALQRADPRAKLVLLGDGHLRAELVGEVRARGLEDRVKFAGMVPARELAGRTRAADFGVDLLDLNLSKRLASSNKFFEYLHAGVPSLCTDAVEHRAVFAKYRVGVLVGDGVAEVARGIDELMFSNEVPAMREACRAAAREYNWQAQVRVLDEVIRSLTAPRDAAEGSVP